MSLTIIFITLIICTAVIVISIFAKSSDQHDKSEIETTALGVGVGDALTLVERRLDEKIDKLEETVERRATQIEERIIELKHSKK